GHRADQVRRDLNAIHVREEALDLADRHSPRIQREHLVVEAREAALVLADQARFKRAVAIARHRDRHRAIVGQDRLPARAVAVIGDVVRLRTAGRIAQMMRELTAQRALDQRLFEATDGCVELLRRDRPRPNELVQDLSGDRCQWCFANQGLTTRSGHTGSSCYAAHTKFLSRAGRPWGTGWVPDTRPTTCEAFRVRILPRPPAARSAAQPTSDAPPFVSVASVAPFINPISPSPPFPHLAGAGEPEGARVASTSPRSAVGAPQRGLGGCASAVRVEKTE